MPIINPDINLEKQLKMNMDDQMILTSSLIVPMSMSAWQYRCVFSVSPAMERRRNSPSFLLANQTAIAIENSHLLEAEHTARKHAEVFHLRTIKQSLDIIFAYDTTAE